MEFGSLYMLDVARGDIVGFIMDSEKIGTTRQEIAPAGSVAVDLEEANRVGFFLVEDILSSDECTDMARRLQRYVAGDTPLPPGMTLQREPAMERNEAHAPPGHDVRKVSGLASDPQFWALICHAGIRDRMQELMGPDLKLFRADALMKPAGGGSAKGPHQDSAYWPIEPMDLWSCWMPFDRATESNGCMQVIPGSHRLGVRPHVHAGDDYVIPGDGGPAGDEPELLSVPMTPGTGLFFHSLLVHSTSANTSTKPRRAVTLSYMSSHYRYLGTSPEPAYRIVSGVEVAGGV